EIILRTSYDFMVLDLNGQILWSYDGDDNSVVGSSYAAPTVGDLDGDGYPEIIATVDECVRPFPEDGAEVPECHSYIHVFDRNFEKQWSYIAPSTPERSTYINSSPTLADLDGDGTLEILFGGANSDFIGQFQVLNKDGEQFQLVNQYELTDLAPWPSMNRSPTNIRAYEPPPVPAEAPGQISVKILDEDGQFPIKWWYSATPDATYQLEESADGGATWAPVSDYVDNTTREVIRTNLVSGSYQYRVRAIKSGHSPSEWVYSGVCQVEIAVEPARFLSVPATKDDGRIYVSWKRSLTAGATYIAEQQVDGGAWALVPEYVDPTATSFYKKDQLSGSYVFRVKAVRNGSYFSDWVTSAPCVVTYAICDDPVGVNATFNWNLGNVFIGWQASSEPDVKYKVEKSSDGGNSWSLVYSTLKLYAWSPVEDGLTYQFRVSARKPGFAASAYVVSSPIVINLIAPPSNMFVKTADPDGQFPIFWWHSPTEGVTYELEESIDGGAYSPVPGFTDVTANKTIKTGAVNGSYQFRIRAVKAGFTPSDWAYSTLCVVGG
ncbi:MAG: VCBS repeat-containing protein, partial [Desulfuromonadales bacterium]|nr:VCBS repeat-containing protein [Desulfuromonadales bacterium]